MGAMRRWQGSNAQHPFSKVSGQQLFGNATSTDVTSGGSLGSGDHEIEPLVEVKFWVAGNEVWRTRTRTSLGGSDLVLRGIGSGKPKPEPPRADKGNPEMNLSGRFRSGFRGNGSREPRLGLVLEVLGSGNWFWGTRTRTSREVLGNPEPEPKPGASSRLVCRQSRF